MTTHEVEQKISDITDKIVRNYKPEKVILFGSYAWGKPTTDSDVDLLIIKKTRRNRLDRQREVSQMLFSSDIAVDALVYTPAEMEEKILHDRNLFLEDIVENGLTLYEYDKIRRPVASQSR